MKKVRYFTVEKCLKIRMKKNKYIEQMKQEINEEIENDQDLILFHQRSIKRLKQQIELRKKLLERVGKQT